ncbi:hypothetical protein M422DRAFT_267142 [Sphaerobolus stellatus SS14]|uniref:Uncharacterized protein n=1 Tax=Sphaerobolus stellatus (strain SS14) TaxID=990650 RepID=A0A0C9UQ61_SPHS4|nr:hypothetical protein M422DRAFT_267142 [Sphaerobolus stellatus SS14]
MHPGTGNLNADSVRIGYSDYRTYSILRVDIRQHETKEEDEADYTRLATAAAATAPAYAACVRCPPVFDVRKQSTLNKRPTLELPTLDLRPLDTNVVHSQAPMLLAPSPTMPLNPDDMFRSHSMSPVPNTTQPRPSTPPNPALLVPQASPPSNTDAVFTCLPSPINPELPLRSPTPTARPPTPAARPISPTQRIPSPPTRHIPTPPTAHSVSSCTRSASSNPNR